MIAKNSEKDLDLVTRFQKREIHWNVDDMEFDIPQGMGTIDQNGVLHTGDQHVSGEITARLKDSNLMAKMKVSVGKLPEVLFNFEDGLGSWKTATANRGEKGLLSVSQYPAPVRFGSQSLQMNFDFTNAQTGTTLGVYAGPGANTAIDGEPTSIGMWVYGTPEAAGYWLRMNLVDGNGKTQTIDLTKNVPGIDWLGWKYIEADIPESFTGPFKISGTQAIRLMSTKSGIAGPMTKGSIYIDNISAWGNEPHPVGHRKVNTEPFHHHHIPEEPAERKDCHHIHSLKDVLEFVQEFIVYKKEYNEEMNT